jgi:SAM-dependent methyltransferase
MPRRPDSFDQVAELYERARPGYPDDLVADLADAARLGPGSRVLEIGPGPGKLSVPLAERGVRLTALEPGGNLAAIARRRLAGYPLAEVVVGKFEDWPAPSEAFDLVAAASSFHWLDPAVRASRAVAALRPGGTLAVIDAYWGVRVDSGDDAFSLASQECYARWDPEHDPDYPGPALAELPERNEELAFCTGIEVVSLRRYVCHRRYSAAEYRDLVGTFSNVIGLDEGSRAGLLGCLTELISRLGGTLERHDVYDLWLAGKQG